VLDEVGPVAQTVAVGAVQMPRRRWLAAGAYALLLIVLSATSPAVTEGDSPEYRAMAEAIARGEPPPPMVHFWLYSALAAPFLRVLPALGFETSTAFTIVNIALLVVACRLAAGLTGWSAIALLFVSPIVWWVDKAHTEVFTFSLLTIAFVALATPRINPGWALVPLGLAAAQNPPAAVFLPIVIALSLATRRVDARDRQFTALCAAGVGLAAVNPVYYFFRVGRAVPLLGYSHGGWPNIDELTAVVRDPNIGLLAHAPVLVFVLAGVLGVLVVKAPASLRRVDAACALSAAVALLFAFSQATNVNNGGTAGPSRYAVWFIPLGLPLLRLFDAVHAGPARRVVLVSSLASVAWSLWFFHPARPENFSGPTPLAAWLWTHHPSLDRPLPEVFIERVRGGDVAWDLPATTSQCEKILLVGRGPSNEMWPIPCMPFDVPDECRTEQTLCYANRDGMAYRFARIPEPSYWAYRFNEFSVWTAAERTTVGALLERWRWWEMRVCDGPESVVRGGVDTGTVHHYCSNDRVVIYVQTPGPSASIAVRLPARMQGAFIDAKTGQPLREVRYEGEAGALWTIAVPTGHGSVVLALEATR
jgi:hypothetical protein